ncbi:PAS domain-containing protein [Myxococcus stipitatus]|uniref:PAS domain-containing protein n=1 Tax=Myxococcus stipitatus TaxID=83455 RepID=UPI001F44B7B0|nr:PAS domain-containing protein [Myxococcus stipitatus]MCE9673059.1 PAS domain-containing protein [Myxococcus stipitatus]
MSGLSQGELSRQLLESLPQLVWMARADGYLEYYNRRWYEYTGLTAEESLGEGWRRVLHPDDQPEAFRRWAHALRGGEPYEMEYRCRRHDGTWRWFLGRARPLRDEQGRVLRWFGTCTDIEDTRRAADSMRFLAEAGALLSSSALDLDDTLAALTRLAVPRLADWCAIELVEDGQSRQVAVAHVDPSRTRLAQQARERYPPRPDDPRGVQAVIRTGRPVLMEEVSEDVLARAAGDVEHLEYLRRLGLRSVLRLPLVARGRALGVLSLVHSESGRRFSPRDVPLGEQLASRAALAVDTARLYRDALRAEERFRSLVTASAQTVWVTDPEGVIVEDSPSWRAFTGQRYEEWRGWGWLDAVHPDDRAAAERAWRAAVTDQRTYEVEYRVRRPDGGYSPTLARAVPVHNPDGTVREWVGTNTDMTAQRRVEEGQRRLDREQAARRMEGLRAEVSGALAREGSVGDILQGCAEALCRCLDARVARLWTYTRGAASLELAGSAGPSAPGTDRWARVPLHGPSLVAEVARTREQVWVNQMEEEPRALGPRWVREEGLRSFAGIPLLVRGQLVGVMGLYSRHVLGEEAVAVLATVADAIAQGLERRRAEEALRLRARELARSNEELQQFAYVASHDLQEPLRMVAGYTQLLARRYQGKLDADADTFIHYAVDGVTRMQRLIQDLLAYSRVGTQGREPGPVDAARAAERAVANLQAAIQESGARLEVGPLPAVLADETQLTQLFQNLIGNALKFRGDGPPRVEVEARTEDAEVRFTVRDYGMGIDARDFERVFVLFQRLHGDGGLSGTGIGLAICKKIVERLGGRIGVESRPGEGSTFWFTLPAAPAPATATEAP